MLVLYFGVWGLYAAAWDMQVPLLPLCTAPGRAFRRVVSVCDTVEYRDTKEYSLTGDRFRPPAPGPSPFSSTAPVSPLPPHPCLRPWSSTSTVGTTGSGACAVPDGLRNKGTGADSPPVLRV